MPSYSAPPAPPSRPHAEVPRGLAPCVPSNTSTACPESGSRSPNAKFVQASLARPSWVHQARPFSVVRTGPPGPRSLRSRASRTAYHGTDSRNMSSRTSQLIAPPKVRHQHTPIAVSPSLPSSPYHEQSVSSLPRTPAGGARGSADGESPYVARRSFRTTEYNPRFARSGCPLLSARLVKQESPLQAGLPLATRTPPLRARPRVRVRLRPDP